MPGPSVKLGAGDLVGRALAVWITTLPHLLLVVAIVHVPLRGLEWWLLAATKGEVWRGTILRLMPVLDWTVFSRIVEGLAVPLVFQRLRRDPPDVARSIRQGVRRFGAVATIAIVTLVVVIVVPAVGAVVVARRSGPSTDALQLFVVAMGTAAVIYPLVFCVSIPSALVEERGPFSAFNRSRKLTSGSHLRILRVWILCFLVTMIPSRILQYLVHELDDRTAEFFAGAALSALVASLTCIVPIVLYHDLRESKEGIGIAELLQVFD
jgi:hypothetical protein